MLKAKQRDTNKGRNADFFSARERKRDMVRIREYKKPFINYVKREKLWKVGGKLLEPR